MSHRKVCSLYPFITCWVNICAYFKFHREWRLRLSNKEIIVCVCMCLFFLCANIKKKTENTNRSNQNSHQVWRNGVALPACFSLRFCKRLCKCAKILWFYSLFPLIFCSSLLLLHNGFRGAHKIAPYRRLVASLFYLIILFHLIFAWLFASLSLYLSIYN